MIVFQVKIPLSLVLLGLLAACGAAPLTQPTAPPVSSSSRIIGGAQTDQMPGVGAFGGCTGTLIGPRKVLTAGHCVYNHVASDFWFDIGPDAYHPQAQVQVTGIELNPGFSPNPADDFGADVALLFLQEDAPVAPVQLIDQIDASWQGTQLVFVGYGQSDGYGGGIGYKRAVQMPITEIDATHIDFGGSGQNICFGDSGGPSFYFDGAGTPYLVGVTSYTTSSDCSTGSAQTRADAYRDFIGASGASPGAPTPPPQSPDPCQGETYIGRCDGGTIVWCENNQVQQENCTAERGYCGFAASAQVNGCLIP